METTWHLKVPKIFHMYWGGEKLPYLRFLTIQSFMNQNPDWKIMFWYPKSSASSVITWSSRELDYSLSCDDYINELKKLPIEINEIDFEDYGFDNNISEVHKSDFLRLQLIADYGGVWSDADIFYFNPITNLSVNTIENKDKETFVCTCYYGHSVGFFMGTAKNAFFTNMAANSINAYKEYLSHIYQYLASDLWNKHYPTLESIEQISPVVNIPMDAVYSNDADDVPSIYDGSPPKFTPNSIGIHWYAGHQLSGKFLEETNGGLNNLPNSVMGNLLKTNHVNNSGICLLLWVTSDCNLSCPLCVVKYSQEMTEGYEMSIAEVKEIIRSSNERGIYYSMIWYSGGEPTVWMHLKEATELFYDSGICRDITLVSNGTNPDRIFEISKMMPYYAISSTQTTPEKLDRFKNSGDVIFYNDGEHKQLPNEPVEDSLPASCCNTRSFVGRQINQVNYIDGKIYYCCNALSLSKKTGLTEDLFCNFEEDFVSKFSNKKYDKDICMYCLCNGNILNNIK